MATLDDVRSSFLTEDERAANERVFGRSRRNSVVVESPPITSINGGINAGVTRLQKMFANDNKEWVQSYQSKYIYPALVIVPLIILFIMAMVLSVSIVVKLIMGILCLMVGIFFYVYVVHTRNDCSRIV